MIRVVLPHHLRTLAKVGDEVIVDLNGSATVKSLLDALEQKYDAQFKAVFDAIRELMAPPAKPKRPIGFTS